MEAHAEGCGACTHAWLGLTSVPLSQPSCHTHCNCRQREQQAVAARQHTAAVMQDVKKQETRVKKAMEKAGEEVCRPARVLCNCGCSCRARRSCLWPTSPHCVA